MSCAHCFAAVEVSSLRRGPLSWGLQLCVCFCVSWLCHCSSQENCTEGELSAQYGANSMAGSKLSFCRLRPAPWVGRTCVRLHSCSGCFDPPGCEPCRTSVDPCMCCNLLQHVNLLGQHTTGPGNTLTTQQQSSQHTHWRLAMGQLVLRCQLGCGLWMWRPPGV